jgi:cytoskeletal protein RodZ
MEGSRIVGQFGTELRRERESRGVTLETISQKTKVIARYLTALEEDNFAVLPGGILSKGILRGYVRTVGLDETVWIERFLAATNPRNPAPGEDGWVEFVENVGRARPARTAHSFRKHWTSVAVLLLLLVGFGWIVWRFVSNRVLADELPHHAVTAAASATADSRALQ